MQQHFNDLVISTYGRGFWIMDDITPLQQLSDTVLGKSAHLFPPRAAYRFGRSPPPPPPTTTRPPEPIPNTARDQLLPRRVGKGGARRRDSRWSGAGDPHPHRAQRGRSEPGALGSPRSARRSGSCFADVRAIVPGVDGRAAPGTARLSILHPRGPIPCGSRWMASPRPSPWWSERTPTRLGPRRTLRLRSRW